VSALGPTLLRAAWLSILLGLGVELVLVLVAAISGSTLQGASVLADSVQKVSWSVLVCAGLALGIVASQMRESMAGLAGLMAAPLAFIIARAAHKSAAQALDLPAMPATGPSPLLLATLKGLEYAALGLALCWIAKRPWGGMAAHAATGAVAGVFFGGTTLWLTIAAAPTPPSVVAVLPRILNELLFPIGCALVLYVAAAFPIRDQ
jgi:hypothetical protein